MKKKTVLIGAGGIGRRWLTEFLAAFSTEQEVAAVIDANPEVLRHAAALPQCQRAAFFADIGTGLQQTRADFCVVATPPQFHEAAILGALERGMNVITEKPLADSWTGCVRIWHAAATAGRRVQIIQNYRDTPRCVRFRDILKSGRLGRINTIALRFLADYRAWASWGGKPFRHEMAHALLVEGAVHHFDLLRFIAGADAEAVTGWEWNPPWSTSRGAFNASFLFRMGNGIVASYEGSGTAAGRQNSWEEETLRAECEFGALALGSDDTLTVSAIGADGRCVEETVPLPATFPSPHVTQLGRFLAWLDGGGEPETSLHQNMATQAMAFAAVEASRTRRVVAMSDYEANRAPEP